MVRFPSEWRHAHGVDLVTTFPPDLGARFRWFERVSPQPTFAGVIARTLASDPDFRAHSVDQMVRVVTLEGEYAAWAVLQGRRQGREAERSIGAVFLDHFAGVLDCIAVMPHHFAKLRWYSFELLRGATFGLSARPRPFYYEPPSGWQAVPSGATATWYPPDFPNNRTNLAIPHASPFEGSAEKARQDAVAALAVGIEVGGADEAAITTPNGVTGTHHSLFGTRGGEPIARQLVVFTVADRAYAFRLETATPDALPAARDALLQAARSFRPLPGEEERRLGKAFPSRSADFDHWAE